MESRCLSFELQRKLQEMLASVGEHLAKAMDDATSGDPICAVREIAKANALLGKAKKALLSPDNRTEVEIGDKVSIGNTETSSDVNLPTRGSEKLVIVETYTNTGK